jgi:hypothetical protein
MVRLHVVVAGEAEGHQGPKVVGAASLTRGDRPESFGQVDDPLGHLLSSGHPHRCDAGVDDRLPGRRPPPIPWRVVHVERASVVFRSGRARVDERHGGKIAFET